MEDDEMLNNTTIWCHGSLPMYENDGDPHDQWYLPARVISLVGPKDYVIVPHHQLIEQFVQFCMVWLGLSEGQVIWTSGQNYLLDHDIRAELLGPLYELYQQKPGPVTFAPYAAISDFYEWVFTLRNGNPDKLRVCGDSLDFVQQFGHKAILHPVIECDAGDHKYQCVQDSIQGLNIPQGFICYTQHGLLEAYARLKEAGVQACMIKPVFAAGGAGIEEIPGELFLRQYEFPLGCPVIIERQLIVAKYLTGKLPEEICWGTNFFGTELFGDLTNNLLNGYGWVGNRSPAAIPVTTKNLINTQIRQILKFLGEHGLQGPGGFDLLGEGVQSVDTGEALCVNSQADLAQVKPWFIDPNIGRFCGGHLVKLFQQRYAQGKIVLGWKFDPPSDVPVADFFAMLDAYQVAYKPLDSGSNSGLFPSCYLPGMWGMMMAVADTHEEVDRLQKFVTNLLEHHTG